MKSALDVHRILLGAGVEHEMVRLRTPIVSGDDLPRGLSMPAACCLVVRCYRTTGRDGNRGLAAVLLRAGDTPDPAALLDALGALAVRPATSAEVNAATDYAASLVSPVGLPDSVELVADAAAGAAEVVYTPTGESGVALGIHTHDLLVHCAARVANVTTRPLADAAGWDDPAGPPTAGGQVLELTRARSARTG